MNNNRLGTHEPVTNDLINAQPATPPLFGEGFQGMQTVVILGGIALLFWMFAQGRRR